MVTPVSTRHHAGHALVAVLFVALGLFSGTAHAQQSASCAEVPEPQRWEDAGTADVGQEDAVISAHRGANQLAPENTLPAYRHAYAYGADLVEADVRTTADGFLVSVHDETVDRTTDGTGAVSDLTLDELRRLDASAYDGFEGGDYAPTRIPTMDEVAALAARTGRGIEFDIKVNAAPQVADLAERYGLLANSIFNTPDPRVAAEYPDARLIYNRNDFEPPASLYTLARQGTYAVFGSSLGEYSPESIAAIHDGCGLVLPHAYDGLTGDEAADLSFGRSIGTDGAQVNRPDLAAATLEEPVPTSLVTRAQGPASTTATIIGERLVDQRYRQGVARVADGWIFTFNDGLYRTDERLVQVDSNEPAIPAELRAQGYNHLGDPDVVDGVLYVPLEQDDYSIDRQLVARYDATSLSFLGADEIAQSHAAWVAVTASSLWSMDEFSGDTLVEYRRSDLSELRRLTLSEPVDRVQGGDLAEGALWLSTDDDDNAIYRVDTVSGAVQPVGSMRHLDGEGEGIDATPRADGLLHTMVIDAEGGEGTWFQHIGVEEPVDLAPEVCLTNAANGLGIPFAELEVGSSGQMVQTGVDGCIDRPGGVVRFSGTPAAQPSSMDVGGTGETEDRTDGAAGGGSQGGGGQGSGGGSEVGGGQGGGGGPAEGGNGSADEAGVVVSRLAGASRIETAVATSRSAFAEDGSADQVVLARADVFVDAVAGTPLAVAAQAPLLLTYPDMLDPTTAAELSRVLAPDGEVVLLGGPDALSETVESDVTGLGFTPRRVAGPNRFGTAVAIAEATTTARGVVAPGVVVIATGGGFADALTAGVAAASQGGVLVLSDGDRPTPETVGYLDGFDGVARVAVGGPAVSAHPEAEPVVGADRFATSVAVAERFFDGPGVVGVASGEVFADALSGGVHIAGRGGPLVLVGSGGLSDPVGGYLRRTGPSIKQVFIYGGTDRIGADIQDAITNQVNSH